MIDIPYIGLRGTDQKGLPLSGSSPLIASECQISNCLRPPASIIVGGAYPGSLAPSDFQISLPVFLSNATATLPSPPTRQKSLSPSTSGWPVNPQLGVSTLYSAFRSFDQRTLPFSASRQSRFPSAPRE